MSHGVAANTRLAGSAQGDFLDDLTNPKVGQWPKTQAIKGISKIVVHTGAIIDSVRITYRLQDGGETTVKHGGDGGKEALSIDLAEGEKLIAVYGYRLESQSAYGNNNIVQLSFVIAGFSGSEPVVQVKTVSGISTAAKVKFELTWALVAASSYTFKPANRTTAYLQGLGFSKVLGQADKPSV